MLSNIMLDDLDRELFKRGHRFVRYADDVMIFVQSERAANRTLTSVATFIERRLKLRVNREKSKVTPAFKASLLGFGYYLAKGQVKIRVDRKAVKRLKGTIRRITSRTWGVSMAHRLDKLNRFSVGWVAYFGLSDTSRVFEEIDQWTRRRLRQVQMVQWKTSKKKDSMLRKLGYKAQEDERIVTGRKRYWRQSRLAAPSIAMNAAYWEAQGYKSFKGSRSRRQPA